MSTREHYDAGMFCWVDLVTTDLAAAARFYEGLFGWEAAEPQVKGQAYRMFRLRGGDVAGVGQMSSQMREGGMPPVWNSYLATDDLEATLEAAVAAGGEVSVPAFSAGPNGRGAFLRDPVGASIGLWEAGEHCGAGLYGVPGAFTWNELATRDVPASRAFYNQVFGWSMSEVDGEVEVALVTFQGQNWGHMLEMSAKWRDSPPHWSVYFAVEDVDAAVTRVTSLGGTAQEPFDAPPGRIAVVHDPQGARFYLIQPAELG